jgi:hypothetical protein
VRLEGGAAKAHLLRSRELLGVNVGELQRIKTKGGSVFPLSKSAYWRPLLFMRVGLVKVLLELGCEMECCPVNVLQAS